MRRRILYGSFALLLVVALLAAFSPIGPLGKIAFGSGGPKIVLQPSHGAPGDTVSVLGTGFGAQETARITFNGVPVASVTTTSGGAFSAAFTVPQGLMPGNYPVSAIGQTSQRTATYQFLAQVNWTQYQFDAANTGFNPYENTINAGNVGSLALTHNPSCGPVAFPTTGTKVVLLNGVVYYAIDDAICAFNAASGALMWVKHFTAGDLPVFLTGYYSPTLNKRLVLATFFSGTVTALNGASGHPLWTINIGDPVVSSTIVANENLYIRGRTSLRAINVVSGATRWQVATPIASGTNNPTLVNGVLYIYQGGTISGPPGTYVVGYSAATGRLRTLIPVPSISTATPAIDYLTALGRWALIVPTLNGMSAIDITTKATLWTFLPTPPSSFSPDWGIAYANGTAYFTWGETLYAVNAANGTLKWSFNPAEGPFTPPFVAGNVVYMASLKSLYAVNAATGRQKWTYFASGGIGAPIVANGVLYAVEATSTAGSLDYFTLPAS